MNYSASVIIPTRDRAASLRNCLASLDQQSLDKEQFEVIVVDNGSRDSTRKIAQSFKDKLNLVYCYADTPGLHTGRHSGMRLARANVISFIDDDVITPTHWLKAIVQNFEDPTVSMVGGNNYPRFESPPPKWLAEAWLRSNDNRKMLPLLSVLDFGEGRYEINPNYIWGCNFSIRKEVLAESKGFHPDAMPKDMLLFRGDGETYVSNFVLNHGLKAMFDSGASVHHCVSVERMSKDYFINRSFANGVSDSFTLLRKHSGRFSSRYLVKYSIFKALRIAKLLFFKITSNELKLLDLKIQHAHWQGFRFHQQECKTRPQLLEWVLRDNYFD